MLCFQWMFAKYLIAEKHRQIFQAGVYTLCPGDRTPNFFGTNGHGETLMLQGCVVCLINTVESRKICPQLMFGLFETGGIQQRPVLFSIYYMNSLMAKILNKFKKYIPMIQDMKQQPTF